MYKDQPQLAFKDKLVQPSDEAALPKLAIDTSARTEMLSNRAQARLKRAQKQIDVAKQAVETEKQRRAASPLLYCGDFDCTKTYVTAKGLAKHEESGKHLYRQSKSLETSCGDYLKKARHTAMVPASVQVVLILVAK